MVMNMIHSGIASQLGRAIVASSEFDRYSACVEHATKRTADGYIRDHTRGQTWMMCGEGIHQHEMM